MLASHMDGWVSGRIHVTAMVGEPPQMLGWSDGDALHYPVLGEGVEIGAYSCVDAGFEYPTRIGAGSWVMKQVHVGHDCVLGERVTIASGSVLGGFVEVGDDSKLGLGVVVLPYRVIGKGCTIGAGAVVTRSVPDGETWAGNPARRVERNSVPFSERYLLEHVGKI